MSVPAQWHVGVTEVIIFELCYSRHCCPINYPRGTAIGICILAVYLLSYVYVSLKSVVIACAVFVSCNDLPSMVFFNGYIHDDDLADLSVDAAKKPV